MCTVHFIIVVATVCNGVANYFIYAKNLFCSS